MGWPNNIERWRDLVEQEAADIPTDLMLAIIQHESGGNPGIASRATTETWPILKADGSFIDYNHALGLTQCIPRTIADYNERHPGALIYYEDMTGTDRRSARLQIRMGAAVYRRAVQSVHRYDESIFPAAYAATAGEEQLKMALIAYAVGAGALRKKLDKLQSDGLPLTFESLSSEFPDWGKSSSGKWVNRPLRYASTVWSRSQNPGGRGTAPSPAPVPAYPVDGNLPATVVAAVALVALTGVVLYLAVTIRS